jgi:hypothetical protein
MSVLVGLAIIGKNNEPLYLCDCVRMLKNHTNDDDDTSVVTDRFGFIDANRARGLGDSLSLERMFMMHAALDRLLEITGATNCNINSMVGRNMTVTSSSPHWMGLLTLIDNDLSVYGYVTATNIKFLALIDHNSSSQTTVQMTPLTKAVKESSVQKFLAETHEQYIRYLMNPFSRPHGPIDSRKFDSSIKAAVQAYQTQTNTRSTTTTTNSTN